MMGSDKQGRVGGRECVRKRQSMVAGNPKARDRVIGGYGPRTAVSPARGSSMMFTRAARQAVTPASCSPRHRGHLTLLD